jgi:uncharacterized protein YdeI (YjbR/CyaY-like superfamily)
MELYFQDREEWRNWLERNYNKSEGVWLIYYKKGSGKPRIPYTDAVEEALCFGWIDGKIKRINKDYFIQWFTPRRAGSRWSNYNVDRVQKLIGLGKMQPVGLAAFREVIEKPHLAYENKTDGDPVIPDDLLDELNNNRKALNNFNKFPPSARRMYIGWLNSAKRPETRTGRILKIINRSERNIKPGMM